MSETQEEKPRTRISGGAIVVVFVLMVMPALLGKSFFSIPPEKTSEVAEKVQTSTEEQSVINHAGQDSVALHDNGQNHNESAFAEQTQKPVTKKVPTGRLERARYYAKQAVANQETDVLLNNGTTVHLLSELKRIGDGIRDRHRNDGIEFLNRERRLPKREKDYYTEFVHRTGNEGPGPCRIIIGSRSEIWYTPDHYKTFSPVNTTAKQLKAH